MEINNVGYKFTHKKGFFINRPNGSGDYVILFLRTGAVFTLGGCDVEAFPNSFILYKKGTPQFFRANSDSFVNDWIHFDLEENEENNGADYLKRTALCHKAVGKILRNCD